MDYEERWKHASHPNSIPSSHFEVYIRGTFTLWLIEIYLLAEVGSKLVEAG